MGDIRGNLRRWARQTRGATAIEFAFTAPLVLVLILATLQVGVVFTAKAYLETAAEYASRIVLTGQATTMGTNSAALTAAQYQAAICAQFPAVFSCSSLVVQLTTLPSVPSTVTTPAQMTAWLQTLLPTLDSNGAPTSTPSYALGASGNTMLLVVEYPMTTVGGLLGLAFGTGTGPLILCSTQIFHNE